jgi:hypothetical protein
VKAARLSAAGGVLSIAGLLALPISAGADTVQGVPMGRASAASFQVTLSPQALLAIPDQVIQALDQLAAASAPITAQANLNLIGSLKTVAQKGVLVSLDASDATGYLTTARNDLAAPSSAQSMALKVDLGGLENLLTLLKTTLDNVIPSLPTQAATDALTTLRSSLPAQVSALLGPAVDQPLTGLINGIAGGVSLTKGVSALLDPTNPAIAVASGDFIPATPLGGSVSPYHAAAVNNSLAASKTNGAFPLNGAQAYADNSTTALTVGQGLQLSSLNASSLGSIITSLQSLIGSLTQATTTIAANPAAPVATVLGTLGLGAISSQLSSLPTSQVTSQISALAAPLQGLLDQLKKLQGAGLDLSGIGVGSLLTTRGVTSTALVQPVNLSGSHGGVNSIATSKFVDIQVLPLTGQLLSTLTQGKLTAGPALLDIQGAQSKASAFVDGFDTSAPTATGSLGSVNILGLQTIDLNNTPLGTDVIKTVGSDAIGWLTVKILHQHTATPTNNTAARKTVGIAPMEIQVLNGNWDTGHTGDHPLFSGTALSPTSSVPFVDAQFVPASVDAAADVVPGSAGGPSGGCVGPCGSTLQTTGILGPWALTVGVALMVVAAAVRLAPIVGGRLRSIR